jgi:hypothetical protein
MTEFELRKPGPIRGLRMGLCTVTVLATFCAGMNAYAGAVQHRSDVLTAQNVAHRDRLEDRVGSAPESLLKRFGKELNVNLSAHVVTPPERMIVADALEQLTPFQREVLQKRLRAIYFIDGMPNNALTFPDGGSTAEPMYSIAVRAGALHETVSDLVTRKERTLFDSAGSDFSVTVDGGTLNAMVYVLLHEATHIVDFAVHATPGAAHPDGNHPLVSGIWQNDRTPVDLYRLPILMSIFWRTRRAMPVARAADLYEALAQTPFISVYASCDSHDDLAELVAWTELTGRLHQPYRILISKGANVVRVIEPAQSHLVRARLNYLGQLTGRTADSSSAHLLPNGLKNLIGKPRLVHGAGQYDAAEQGGRLKDGFLPVAAELREDFLESALEGRLEFGR